MGPNLKKFRIFPSVIESDKESTLQIESYDANFLFFDDITYYIEVFPAEETDVPYDRLHLLDYYNKNRKTYAMKPENGVISFSYYFKGEQEWKIHIWCDEYETHQNPLYEHQEHCWDWLVNAPKQGVYLSVYSVCKDLLSRKVLRGDFHLHTSASDGSESPEMTVSKYRMHGYDTIAVTDHYLFDTARQLRETLSPLTDFTILPAEEVHNGYIGQFHIINIGSDVSINQMFFEEPERIRQEVLALASEISVPDGLPAEEYLYRVWIYREIKKHGGFMIYPHPYWFVGNHYHTETKMSIAVLENKLCDALEVLGGCTFYGNNLQMMLHHTLSANGLKIPVVGSTDCHSVLGGSAFCSASTILFAKENQITEAIGEGYSVAVQSAQGNMPFVYGDFRLVKYAIFLLENYFPIHDELCRTSGEVMADYLSKDASLRETFVHLEQRIRDFSAHFFAKISENEEI